METLRMQPGRFSKLYLVTPIDDDKEMEPVATIAAHLADIIHNFNDIHAFSSKNVC